MVDEVYISVNYDGEFHWVLIVVALKERCTRVYDTLSSSRHRDSLPEIHKLIVILPTYLTDSEFLELTTRTDWPNLQTYMDKMSPCTQIVNQYPFDIMYINQITQQSSGSL